MTTPTGLGGGRRCLALLPEVAPTLARTSSSTSMLVRADQRGPTRCGCRSATAPPRSSG